MNPDLITNLFTVSGFVQLMSYIITAAIAFYVLIAFIMVREVSLMTKSFSTPMGPLFKFVAYTHFLLSVIVLLISIIAL